MGKSLISSRTLKDKFTLNTEIRLGSEFAQTEVGGKVALVERNRYPFSPHRIERERESERETNRQKTKESQTKLKKQTLSSNLLLQALPLSFPPFPLFFFYFFTPLSGHCRWRIWVMQDRSKL